MKPFDYILWFLFGDKKRSINILAIIVIELAFFELLFGYFF